jgi:hypothetical protein
MECSEPGVAKRGARVRSSGSRLTALGHCTIAVAPVQDSRWLERRFTRPLEKSTTPGLRSHSARGRRALRGRFAGIRSAISKEGWRPSDDQTVDVGCSGRRHIPRSRLRTLETLCARDRDRQRVPPASCRYSMCAWAADGELPSSLASSSVASAQDSECPAASSQLLSPWLLSVCHGTSRTNRRAARAG